MALNKFMHPKNLYRNPPDFKKLAIDYPEFRKCVKQDLSGKVRLDFKDEKALRALTKCLLHRDFQLSVELPSDRLVPTLPLRLNYILWIDDLLTACNIPKESVRGIDIGDFLSVSAIKGSQKIIDLRFTRKTILKLKYIFCFFCFVGTGASCIYPLLGARKFNWSMLGTEIDPDSIKCAVENVERNNLGNLITVKEVTEDVILDGVFEGKYDFTMCNPPFFSDVSELEGKGRSEDRAPPRNAPSGTTHELVAPGGEIAFIGRIIVDSAKLRDAIRIYTVMVGHKSSVLGLKKATREAGAVSVVTGEFCQGRTTRWGLAWSFSEDLGAVEKAGGFPSHRNKPPLRFSLPYPPGDDQFETVKKQLQEHIDQLKITVDAQTEDEGSFGMTIRAVENTWANQRRQRRLKKLKAATDGQGEAPSRSGAEEEKDQSVLNKEEESGLKRPYENSDDEEGAATKKLKKDPENETTSKKNEPCLLVASLILYDCESEFLLQISYMEGKGGREAANQVLQYIKNQFLKNA